MAIDNQKAIATLTNLRDQIDPPISKSKMDVDILQWQCSVLDNLEKIFGPNSKETKEFQQIFFDLPPEIIDRFRARVKTHLKDTVNIDLPDDFTIPQDNYFDQKLYEAQAFLLSIIVILRRK